MKWIIAAAFVLALLAAAVAVTVGVVGHTTTRTELVVTYLLTASAVATLSAVILSVGERILGHLRARDAYDRIAQGDDSNGIRRIR